MGQQVVVALRESMHRALVKLVSFLPGLLALILAVALLAAIGAALAFLIRRILIAVRFDERFVRARNPAVADWAPSHAPTTLIARTVFWGCVVLGLLIGLSAFDASYSSNAAVAPFLLPYLTHSVSAILIFLAGTLVARFLARSVLIGAVNLQLQYARFLSLGVKWLVLTVTSAMVLEHLEIGGAIVDIAFGILFGGIVLTLSLAIGLGSRDLVSRSLERTAAAERRDDLDNLHATPSPSRPAETLRHF